MKFIRKVDKIFNVITFYENKIASLEKEILLSKRRRILIAISRLALFALFIALVIFAFMGYGFAPFGAVIFIIAFIALTIYDQNFEKKYKKLLTLKDLNEKEIRCVKKDPSGFRDGSRFADPKHDYSFDLDIFEPSSIFQHINRTASIEGEEHLARNILSIELDRDEILKNSAAVKELAGLTDVRQAVAASGMKKQISLGELLKYASQGKKLTIPKSFIWFSYFSVSVTIICVVLYLFKILPSAPAFIMFMFQLILSFAYKTKINSVYGNLNNASEGLAAYANISSIISGQAFQSEKLKSIAQNIESMEKETKILGKILNDFDSRNNGLIYIAINGLFLKDIFSARKTALWFERNGENIPRWPKFTAAFEALSSLGNFAFNNQDFTFPEISNDEILQAKNICHPLIEREKRVGNDINVDSQGEFFLITGANMAGKSTFIRSIGINLVLACLGAPVCAESFCFRPAKLFTSMRTSDKLLESASYFQAELARLRMMKDRIEENEFTIVLLDEILKGTNSGDKLEGSRLVLINLIKMKASGFVSTHDTALYVLEEEMPASFKNYSFEFGVSPEGELIFDYKLRRGVSKNMNAGILLKRIFN